MNDKYIKLEDAIKIIRERRREEYDERDEMFNLGLQNAESELEGLPAIEINEDASVGELVEIVRCKACEEWDKEWHTCTLFDIEMEYNDFCSYGSEK